MFDRTQPRLAALALAAGDALRQRLSRRRRLHRRAGRTYRGALGRESASARICCFPITAFRPSYVARGRSLPGAGGGDHPDCSCRDWAWRRTTGRIAISRASARWSGCSPTRKIRSQALAKRGLRKLTIVSPSFAVDCLETLEECAIEYRDKFLELGGERLTLVPASERRRPPCRSARRRHSTPAGGLGRGGFLTPAVVLSVLSSGIWLYLVFAHGRFWRSTPQLAPAVPSQAPDVDVVVPARDEAATIGRVIASLAGAGLCRAVPHFPGR